MDLEFSRKYISQLKIGALYTKIVPKRASAAGNADPWITCWENLIFIIANVYWVMGFILKRSI